MAKLGFVGLGAMGGRIAKRLMDAGHTVTGYNRTKSKAQWLLDAGMHWVDSPKSVAEGSEITFSMVTDSAALQAIADGPDGVIAGLVSGKIYVDMSTVNPDVSRELAAKAKTKGAQMLDSPVSGSILTLEQGNLTMMVGGEEAAFKKIEPVLLSIGPKATYVGPNGQAVSMKIATNLSIGVQMLALSESVLLAEKAGIKREVALEVLTNSVIASPLVKYRGPFLLNMPEQAWFDVNMMQKDMNLALELGEKVGAALPASKVTNDMLTKAKEMGLAEKDFAVIFEVLAKQAGEK